MPIMTAPALPVTAEQRADLWRMAMSSSLPHRKVVQARALLWATEGVGNEEIARRCDVDSDTVRRWRGRFAGKTQVQARARTQPSLPMRPGRAGTMTHDYKRHGTVDLFAALNVATGEVLTDYQKRHTAADVLRFFKHIDASVDRGLQIHVVLDNLSAHKAPEVTTWLAHPRRKRWQ